MNNPNALNSAFQMALSLSKEHLGHSWSLLWSRPILCVIGRLARFIKYRWIRSRTLAVSIVWCRAYSIETDLQYHWHLVDQMTHSFVFIRWLYRTQVIFLTSMQHNIGKYNLQNKRLVKQTLTHVIGLCSFVHSYSCKTRTVCAHNNQMDCL